MKEFHCLVYPGKQIRQTKYTLKIICLGYSYHETKLCFGHGLDPREFGPAHTECWTRSQHLKVAHMSHSLQGTLQHSQLEWETFGGCSFPRRPQPQTRAIGTCFVNLNIYNDLIKTRLVAIVSQSIDIDSIDSRILISM